VVLDYNTGIRSYLNTLPFSVKEKMPNICIVRELLGDYEKRGESLKRLGKFVALVLDDPFHATTVTGLALYGMGKIAERRTNYGLRLAYMSVREGEKAIREGLLDIMSLRF